MTGFEAMAHEWFDEIERAIVRSPLAVPAWPPATRKQAIDMLRRRYPQADYRTIEGAAALACEWLEIKESVNV